MQESSPISKFRIILAPTSFNMIAYTDMTASDTWWLMRDDSLSHITSKLLQAPCEQRLHFSLKTYRHIRQHMVAPSKQEAIMKLGPKLDLTYNVRFKAFPTYTLKKKVLHYQMSTRRIFNL